MTKNRAQVWYMQGLSDQCSLQTFPVPQETPEAKPLNFASVANKASSLSLRLSNSPPQYMQISFNRIIFKSFRPPAHKWVHQQCTCRRLGFGGFWCGCFLALVLRAYGLRNCTPPRAHCIRLEFQRPKNCCVALLYFKVQ